MAKGAAVADVDYVSLSHSFDTRDDILHVKILATVPRSMPHYVISRCPCT